MHGLLLLLVLQLLLVMLQLHVLRVFVLRMLRVVMLLRLLTILAREGVILRIHDTELSNHRSGATAGGDRKKKHGGKDKKDQRYFGDVFWLTVRLKSFEKIDSMELFLNFMKTCSKTKLAEKNANLVEQESDAKREFVFLL